MKTLIGIGLLQTACLLYLVIQVSGNSPEQDPVVPTAQPDTPASTATQNPFAATRSSRPAATGPAIDEQQLRRVIREELQRLVAANPELLAEREDPVNERPPDPFQREYVEQQINHYKNVGEISGRELDDLMRDIAMLDEASRKQVLPQLMRALNQREIDGRF